MDSAPSQHDDSPHSDAPRPTIAAGWRVALSVVIAAHLAAIVAPAFYNATDWGEPSYAALQWERFASPYTRALHLHHAYFFFAPDPGPAYSIAYRAEFDDGREPIEGKFPDRRRQFPRLLYHRYFMLSEQIANLYVEPQPPPEDAGPDMRRDWAMGRATFERRARAFRDHLRYQLGADRVQLRLIEHRQPTLAEFFAGTPIDDPRLFDEIPLLAPATNPPPGAKGPAIRRNQPETRPPAVLRPPPDEPESRIPLRPPEVISDQD